MNTISKASRDCGNGNGIADIVLWTKDKVYVWEIKSRGGQGKFDGEWQSNYQLGPKQLDRYISGLRRELEAKGDNREVEAGFGLPTSATVAGNGGTMRTWSGNERTHKGIRFYSKPEKKKQPQTQEQEQEQEQPAPAPAMPCGGGTGPIAAGPCAPQPIMPWWEPFAPSAPAPEPEPYCILVCV